MDEVDERDGMDFVDEVDEVDAVYLASPFSWGDRKTGGLRQVSGVLRERVPGGGR